VAKQVAVKVLASGIVTAAFHWGGYKVKLTSFPRVGCRFCFCSAHLSEGPAIKVVTAIDSKCVHGGENDLHESALF
jgi:hypothetical protein